jgi:hypothetical protein
MGKIYEEVIDRFIWLGSKIISPGPFLNSSEKLVGFLTHQN